MKLVSLAVLLITLLAMPAIAYDWIQNPANGHWYSLTKTGLTWFAARDAANSEGGYLSTINDQEEERWIIETYGPLYLWIGFTDYEEEGRWHWINREPITYTHWNAGEPNNVHNEDFGGIVMNENDKWNNHWNDFNDITVQFGLIERNASVPEPASLLALATGIITLTTLKRRKIG